MQFLQRASGYTAKFETFNQNRLLRLHSAPRCHQERDEHDDRHGHANPSGSVRSLIIRYAQPIQSSIHAPTPSSIMVKPSVSVVQSVTSCVYCQRLNVKNSLYDVQRLVERFGPEADRLVYHRVFMRVSGRLHRDDDRRSAHVGEGDFHNRPD